MNQRNDATHDTAGTHERITTFKPDQWFLEEYKLLSQHYFHEDNQLQKTITIYATLNGGLLAFLASSFSVDQGVARILLPVVGIVLCVSWVATLIRIRECRNYIERRISTIEGSLHTLWEGVDPLPLDIRTKRHWSGWRPEKQWFNMPYLAFRDVPSSLVYLILPSGFASVWIFLLIAQLR